MAKLAILGHATRGREVIELLEMLGGKNRANLTGTRQIWYILSNGTIDYSSFIFGKGFSLEEFLEKFPYKVGDKVSSKYLKNYKIEKMEWMDTHNRVIYKLQGMGWYRADELQPYKEEAMEEKADTSMAPILQSEDYSGRRFGYKIPKGYEFDCIKKNEIIIKPIKSQYPKTYEECCEILNIKCDFYIDLDVEEIFIHLIKLKRCRDVYWKIAGERMGLGKAWEPDWNNDTEKYVIYPFQYLYSIDKENYRNTILAFPTKEMRDAFYENFKNLIDACKELL